MFGCEGAEVEECCVGGWGGGEGEEGREGGGREVVGEALEREWG